MSNLQKHFQILQQPQNSPKGPQKLKVTSKYHQIKKNKNEILTKNENYQPI